MKAFFAGLAALSSLAVAPAAFADVITINPSVPAGTFENLNVICTGDPCTWSDSGTFATPFGYDTVGATITTGPAFSFHGDDDIDFLTGFLNGQAFTFSVPAGVYDTGVRFAVPLNPFGGALNTLSFSGIGYGQNPSASYSGTLTFSNRGVPEPGTWMMMLLGFAGVGLMLRKGRKSAGGRLSLTSPALPQLA